MALYMLAVVIIALLTSICVAYIFDDDNVDFLKGYGWEVNEKYIEKSELTIPLVFDDVYIGYNEIQKQAGLDLSKYKGEKAVRYTYEVKNYPKEVGEVVRANVICVDGEAVGGDIMTVSINGFMHSLNYPK